MSKKPHLSVVSGEGSGGGGPTEEKKGPLMMRGTGKHLDYIVVARRGEIALGVKPYPIFTGPTKKNGLVEQATAIITFRLRSMRAPQLFEGDTNVVKLADKSLTTTSAWPAVELWEKKERHENVGDKLVEDFYSSTSIGAPLLGDLNTDQETILKQLEGTEVWENLGVFLKAVAGEDNMVISEGELIEWLKAFYQPVVDGIRKNQEMNAELTQKLTSDIGVFRVWSKAYKDVHDKHNPQSEEVADLDAEQEVYDIEGEQE